MRRSPQNGLEQVLDFVPNHMGVGGADNPLWLDVLEWGPDSAHAGWFDIDWDPDRRYLRDKLLVPLLGDQYGVELEAGQLVLKFDEQEGSFAVWAYDTHKLPICPLHYARILGDAHPELERLGDAFSGLPEWRPQVGSAPASSRQSSPRSAANGPMCGTRSRPRSGGSMGALDSWRGLDALIQDQYWRAAHFRVAADDINYRRFFNINDLAGIRMELPEVFDHAHRLVFRLSEKRRPRRSAHRPYRRAARSQGLSEQAAREGAGPTSISWSRRSSRRTNRCARTGRSRAPPATTSPTSFSRCWSIRPARRASAASTPA